MARINPKLNIKKLARETIGFAPEGQRDDVSMSDSLSSFFSPKEIPKTDERYEKPSVTTITTKKGRPSPRTQGVDEEGKTFQKFGTQQLKFVADTGGAPKLGTPYQGVTQVDTGKNFKGITTSLYGGTKSTVFSERFQAGITGATPTALRETALVKQKEKLEEMGLPEIKIPAWEELFPPEPIDKHGCECEACKNGTGQCSDKRPECDSWDLACELGGGLTDIISKPAGDWWDKYGIWVYGILAIIGIGVLLWLLRPLFGIAKNVTGVSKSAVTRVNGMK